MWPVRTSFGNASRRASRALASKFGPSGTDTVTKLDLAPKRLAASATSSPSADDPSRSPWSTCHAVTSNP